MPDYQTLRRYTRPQNFADFSGIDRTAYYVAYAQHRDSDSVTRSNFRSILRAIGGESDTVFILRSSHWAVGWIEEIYVDPSNTIACTEADEILSALEDYPLVNDDDHSALEWDEACAYWESMSVAERVTYLQRADLCIFAARRAELPEDPAGRLFERLTSN